MSGSVLNILIKVIALLLAVLLWFYVISQKDYEYELTLPVTEVDLPENLGLVSGKPDSLTVKVFAEGQKLLSSPWKQAGLRLKGTRLRRGMNNLELNLGTIALVRSEDITLLNIVSQSSVQMHLDRIDSTLKPVASRLAVVPADGYTTVGGTKNVTPELVKISGPAFLLGRVDSIYSEQKILDNINKPVEITLKLDIPDTLSLVPEVDSVLISVLVDKVVTRKFEDFPISVRNTHRGNRVIIDPDRVSFEIEGPKAVVDSLTADDFKVWVTPSLPMGDERIAPEITLPANIRLKSIHPDSVRILVEN